MNWNRFYPLICMYRNGKINRDLSIIEWRLAQKKIRLAQGGRYESKY
jgi:hypothetical protein